MKDMITERARLKKVRDMKAPIIAMNPKDFKKVFPDKLDDPAPGFFNGLPLKTSLLVQEGTVLIYDSATKPVCSLCNDTGYYNVGGSFGGPVLITKCLCGFLKK